MPARLLAIVIFLFLGGISLVLSSADVQAGSYSWIDEKGVTHFSDEKPASTITRDQGEPSPEKSNEKTDESFEQRYTDICGNLSDLHHVSVTVLDGYMEKIAGLRGEIESDSSLTQEARNMLIKRLDSCAARFLSAREAAQRRKSYQENMHDKLVTKMQRFDKLRVLVAERLEQHRASLVAKDTEGDALYVVLKLMEENPLKYGMPKQVVERIWGDPLSSQKITATPGEMMRESYPLGIDLYFKDGLLETWGWRE